MLVRNLALTAAVSVGALGFAGKADAQVVYSSGYYSYPGAVYSSSYYAPAFGYSPSIYPASFYTPPYNAGWYWSGYNYQRSNPYYSGYRRGYYPYARSYYGRRGWRW